MPQKFLDIEITLDRKRLSEKLNDCEKGIMATINANIVVHAFVNKEYQFILQRNTTNICDGSVLATIINRIYKTNFPSYPGPDLFMDTIMQKRYKHVFLGSTKEVLNALRNNLISIDESIKSSLFIELPFCEV